MNIWGLGQNVSSQMSPHAHVWGTLSLAGGTASESHGTLRGGDGENVAGEGHWGPWKVILTSGLNQDVGSSHC